MADDLTPLVRQAFADALGREIGPDDDFFDAGGDSVSAEAVLTSLSSAFSVDLPGWLLLDHSTARRMADILASRDTS